MVQMHTCQSFAGTLQASKAKISLMLQWLVECNESMSMPCNFHDSSHQHKEPADMVAPCEDLISTSSFCHGLGFVQDGYCQCKQAFEELSNAVDCDQNGTYTPGIGLFVPGELCRCTCGTCLIGSEDSHWFGSCLATGVMHMVVTMFWQLLCSIGDSLFCLL